MYNSLDASSFQYSHEIHRIEFEKILLGIIRCYFMMLDDKILVPNLEEKIRNCLYNDYLKINSIRQRVGLSDYLFDCEVAEYDKVGKLVGKLDFKISTKNTFNENRSYFIVECKRLNNKNLDGSSGLNAEYIREGINRFVTTKYSSFHRVNGMIGFIVEKTNIIQNVNSINKLMKTKFKNNNVLQELKVHKLDKKFNHVYLSKHKDAQNREIKLYHLMFDLSKNVEDNSD